MSTIGKIDYRKFYKDYKHFILPEDVDSFDGFLIGALDICLTTKCSLHCEGCAHLMYLHKNRSDWQSDEVISALERIFEHVDYIARINLIGGEPLLYKDLPVIMDYLATKKDFFGIVKITTNGTIIPKEQKTYDSLRHPWTKICISNYHLSQTRAPELKETLDEQGILWTDTIYDLDDGWYDFGDTEPRHKTQEQLEEQYRRCDVEWFSLYNNKIYACPRAAQMDALDIFDATEDSIDIHDNDFAQKLWEYIYDRKTHECCDRCNLGTDDIKHIPVAAQLPSKQNK